MLLNDVEGKLAKCFLDPTEPTFTIMYDEFCIALWGFYVSLLKVQEHLLNQSIYVSCLCQVIVLEYPIIKHLSDITQLRN